ncbi:MAG: energy-coupling factor ABC transporter ATP-binding protein [Actinomycetota bacterium]|nr:energy-coupling factor ABC transporter ATP-binding protein [Actinomycetota bacterium]
MTPAAVEIRGFGYRPPTRTSWALRDVDLAVAPGEHVLLLGASGSGKSTLLRAMAGLLDAGGDTAGAVQVDGRPATSARDRVGLLMQDPDAFLVLSRAGEDVAFGPQNRGLPPDEVEERVARALRAAGFPYSAERPVAALSGGERQRLALAGVLALAPGLLLLDEPTSMLDPEGAALVRRSVGEAARASGVTLVVVEHRVADWLPLVDRVVVLTPDGVAADGAPDTVATHPAARDTWLGGPPALVPRPPASRAPAGRLLTATAVTYRHQGAAVDALSAVDCSADAGSVLAVTGPNGSGKSTLARLLGGLAAPTSGAVTASPALTGAALADGRPHRWRARDLAGRIGSVFQNPEHAFLTGSVREELAIGPRAVLPGRADLAELVDRLLDQLRLTHLAEANPFTLSGGEQRRLSVGAALATAPRLLVLDEPTFGQDPTTWRELVSLALDLRDAGAGLVVVTHDLAFRDAVADASLRLDSGKVVST